MSLQKMLIGTLIAFVFVFALDYLWYGMLMKDFFGSTPGVDRASPLFPWLILGILIYAWAFCRIYRKGYEDDKTLVSQGINYGILVSLLIWVPMSLIQYAVVESHPLTHYLVDLVYRVVTTVILGVIIAKYFGSLSIAERPGMTGSGEG